MMRRDGGSEYYGSTTISTNNPRRHHHNLMSSSSNSLVIERFGGCHSNSNINPAPPSINNSLVTTASASTSASTASTSASTASASASTASASTASASTASASISKSDACAATTTTTTNRSNATSTSTTVRATARSGTHAHLYYREEALIGNGAYGTVYRASVIDTKLPATLDLDGGKMSGRFVALKKVRIPWTEDGVPVSILREIGLLRQLDRFQHPNIVRFLDVCTSATKNNENTNEPLLSSSLTLYLVFEYLDLDLGQYILKRSAELNQTRIKELSWELLSGVDFLHGHRIVHRDLKPQNLLISSTTGQLKIADFGLAKIYDFTMRLTTVVVTLWYRSPEVLLGGTYGTPVDLWSVGCILAELYRRRPLLPGDSEKDQILRTFDLLGTPSESDWPAQSPLSPRGFINNFTPPKSLPSLIPGICPPGESLLSKLLTFNPMKRISARDALREPYFHKTDDTSTVAFLASSTSSNTVCTSSPAFSAPTSTASSMDCQ